MERADRVAFGAMFGNREREAGTKAMVARLAGSTLLFAAIALVIININP